MNRNNYYRNSSTNRASYILGAIIIGMIWLVKTMHKDTIDASETMAQMNKECAYMDSICREKTRQTDSIKQVLNWYKEQDEIRRAKEDKKKFVRKKFQIAPADTIN